ncbi:uncharacterized protein EDB91DRAFT_1080627 [Suillus paluster]|uniref:uncharacterized protein n=1 Tax=Suillus paluster TaxID=48578 RepID=UPI001B85D63B|nr:uncharacterized protein EDB91DRAFT_1080627 [Suillus paluster]KAG1744512.1 hypothetical protein EDB91DRAFT_1080627 [Suillus paluster]
MVELVCLGQALSNIHGLSLETILTFVTLVSAVKEDMILAQPATYDVSTPPDFMPPSVSLFLGSACSLTQDSVRICWSTLKHDIWKDIFTLQHNTHSLFEQFGYPHGLNPLTRPSHIFYDNNCHLAQHVKDDPFFNDISLSVDVFHFNCKHSKNDLFCQENCNPMAFPELTVDGDGKWYFNSSEPPYIREVEEGAPEAVAVGVH